MTPGAKGVSREEEAIRNRVEEFVSSWNRHDSRAMARLYSEEGDLLNPFGRAAKSRSQIEELFRDEHSSFLKESRFSIKHEGVRFLTPEVALGNYSFEITGARDSAGKEQVIKGHLTNIYKKQGDQWWCESSRPMIPTERPR
jgi:uncharacterized protein (TIGR02246 family)